MAQHARLGVDSATAAAGELRHETAGRRAEDVVDLSRSIVHLLGEQFRHGLAIAAAVGRVIAWEEIIRAQAEFLHASLDYRRRSDGETAARPVEQRSPSIRADKRSVRAVLKRRCPVVAPPDETVQVAAERMTKEVCGSVLVCDGDRLSGIFTDRDLMTRVVSKGLDPRTTPLAEVMTRDPDRIESTATAQEALRRMDGFAYHLPVVEDGRALGVISLQDLPPETLAGMLPELEQRQALAERMR
jgi:CBS domain-containing protein